MLVLLCIVLIIMSTLLFILGYAYLNNKAEDLLLWRITGKSKNIKDKEAYMKQQGKQAILNGVIFLLVPISLYLIESLNLDPKLLYIWLVVMASITIINGIQVRRFMK